ncbi:MAG: HAMP domain-containing histidine kinase [Thermoflexibacter sp.]|nr:HAMP domain-containing histidine kinase [Thermoflexibacter sp.]
MNVRTKLLFSYLLFILLGSINIQIALWLNGGYREVNTFVQYFNEIRVKTQQNIAQSQHFLLYETINPHFFEKKESNILSKRRETVASIHQNLKLLKEYPLSKKVNFSHRLDTLMLLLDNYELIFEDLIETTFNRGFKDAGLEGEMRQYAHQLEASNIMSLSQILTLRRWEKDYIIRHDSISITRFNREITLLLSQFKNNRQILSLLDSYQNCFDKIITLEQKIGKNTDTGLTLSLRIQSNKIEIYLIETLKYLDVIHAEIIDELMNTFWMVIFIMLFISVLLSILIASRFTKPILAISNMLRHIIQSNFDKNVPIIKLSGKDEMAKMSEHLALMIKKMQESFTFLNLQNQEITEKNIALVKFNQQIVESENQLKRMNHIKDKFFSIIAHDLRGPFNTLKGFIHILMTYSEGLSKEEIKDLLLQLNESIKNISNLTNNLLEWALTQTEGIKIELRDINLFDVTEDTISLFHYEAYKKRITIHNRIDREIRVQSDQNILYFVVRNLLSNAIKFTKENGEIRVECAEVNGQVYTQIIDNGIGMPKELLDKLFVLGEKVNRDGTEKEKGTGIGLLMCKDFLEKNGGKITVNSEKGKGSVFTFVLPVVVANESLEQPNTNPIDKS